MELTKFLDLVLYIALIAAGAACTGIPLIYLLWMKKIALSSDWNIKIDKQYLPTVDVLLPTYNEHEVIVRKLQDLCRQDYPVNLLRVIVIDSGSDETFDIAKEFVNKDHSGIRFEIIKEDLRRGKSSALNQGLKLVQGDIVVTTDADAYWMPDALRKMVKYFADPQIGAVTGTESILNPLKSSATKSEVAYHSWYLYYRLGESKLQSTLITNGEMMAYRKNLISRFDDSTGADDSGTALQLVMNGFRCIQIDEAKFYDNVYYTWKGKTEVKVRRAEQLVAIWLKCFRLAIQKKIKLSRKVLFFNFYLHIINPIVLLLFGALFLLVAAKQPLILIPLAILLLYSKTRNYFISFVSHNIFLVIGILQYATGKKQVVWKKVQETRALPLPTIIEDAPVRHQATMKERD